MDSFMFKMCESLLTRNRNTAERNFYVEYVKDDAVCHNYYEPFTTFERIKERLENKVIGHPTVNVYEVHGRILVGTFQG